VAECVSTSCVIAVSSAAQVALAMPRTRSRVRRGDRVMVGAWGYVTQHDVDDVFAIIDRAGAMTWSRMHSR
jgi:hypothetical protein